MSQEPKQFQCVIWGGYGWGNTGDEICLAVALERLRQKYDGAVAVLTHNPEYTSWLFPGVNVLPYVHTSRRFSRRCKNFARNLFAAWSSSTRNRTAHGRLFSFKPEGMRQLSRARRLYLCGGGYLTDSLSLDVVMPPILQAAKMKLPIESAPIGIGPFKSSRWAQKVAQALEHADLKVRDEASLAFCRSHGLHASLEPDDAFAWARLIPPLAVAGPDSSRPYKIGVCIFSQNGEGANHDWAGWWTSCLRRLRVQHPGFEIEGFSFHASPQFEFREMIRLFAGAGLSESKMLPPMMDFRKAAAAIRSYDFIISTRFHAIVAANVFKIPNIAIATGDYYLSKMRAAIREHENSSWLVDPAVQSPESLLEICQRELATHHQAAK